MRTLANGKRGCGHLKKGAIYLHSDVSERGDLPPIVLFDPAIPWPEEHFRGWKAVNGQQFITLMQPHSRLPWAPLINEQYQAEYGGGGWEYSTEEERYDGRLMDGLGAAMRTEAMASNRPRVEALETFDLLQWVGESYYPTPQHFIDEVLAQGLNKRLALRQPPRILSGYTRLFLAHKAGTIGRPDGTEEAGPVIFGYAYVTDVLYTIPDDKRMVPTSVEDWCHTGLLEMVEVGREDGNDLEDRAEPAAEAVGAAGEEEDGADRTVHGEDAPVG